MAKKLLQRLVGILSICLLAVSGLTAFLPVQKVSAEGVDCDANAVIFCGVTDVANLKAKYQMNQGGDLHAIYNHFGIPNEAAMDGMVLGKVTKSGEVWAGDQKVATGAVTAGRIRMGADEVQVPGATAFMRPPSRSFRSESLSAWVKMDGRTFAFAVIRSCGNPVSAADRNVLPPPPTPPAPPKPPEQPKPEKPELEIKKDVSIPGETEFQQNINVDPDGKLEYRITVKNTGETALRNLHIQDSLPDGVSFEDTSLGGSQEVRGFKISDLVGEGITIDTLAKDGDIEIIFTVTVGSDTDACEEPMRNVAFAKAIDVPEEEDDALAKVCQPEKEEEKPQVKGEQTPPPAKLPDTGAAGAIGIFSVTSFLGFATYKLKEFYSVFLRR